MRMGAQVGFLLTFEQAVFNAEAAATDSPFVRLQQGAARAAEGAAGVDFLQLGVQVCGSKATR